MKEPTGSPTKELGVFEEQFLLGQPPSTAVCQAWVNFMESLTGTYSELTISGSQDTTGLTCSDPTAVALLANALNNDPAGLSRYSKIADVACNGLQWFVTNGCSQNGLSCVFDAIDAIELSVWPLGSNPTQPGCDPCSYASHAVIRPSNGHSHWGGLNGDKCNAPDQSIRVQFSVRNLVYYYHIYLRFAQVVKLSFSQPLLAPRLFISSQRVVRQRSQPHPQPRSLLHHLPRSVVSVLWYIILSSI